MIPAHAPEDAPFAQQLSTFLEAGCDAICFTSDGAIKSGQDLISAADDGLSADILILILSKASTPAEWVLKRWESVLFDRADEMHTHVATFVIEECKFPGRLRHQVKFFNATTEPLTAMRRLKRWICGIRSGTEPSMAISPDLDALYRDLDDGPGICTVSGTMAQRFAVEAAADFDAVFWIPAFGRTLAQIAGELGVQLRANLDGPLEENCGRIRSLLSPKRCLLILDAPQVAVEELLPAGRASVLFTADPVRVVRGAPGLAAARSLLSDRRFAEAYEMLYTLLNSGVEKEACGRELVWICEHWDRLDEANGLRYHFGPSPTEQLRLF